jgi:hypothetical protein
MNDLDNPGTLLRQQLSLVVPFREFACVECPEIPIAHRVGQVYKNERIP